MTIYPNCIARIYRTRIGDSTHFKNTLISVNPIHREQLTGYAGAVIAEYAPRLAYLGLRSCYSRSASKKVRALMTDIVHDSKTGVSQRMIALSDYTSEENIKSTMYGKIAYVTKRGNLTANAERELLYANDRQSTVIQTHHNRMIDNLEIELSEPVDVYRWQILDGCEMKKFYKTKRIVKVHHKRVLSAIIPWSEIKRTIYGRMLDSALILPDDLDGMDFVQEVALALTVLMQADIIRKPSDIWEYSGYCYNAVNTALYKHLSHNSDTDADKLIQRAHDSESNEICTAHGTIIHSDGSTEMVETQYKRPRDIIQSAIDFGFASDISDKIASQPMYKEISNILRNHFSAQKQTRKYVDRYLLCWDAYIAGYPNNITASYLNISKQKVSNILSLCKKALRTPAVIAILQGMDISEFSSETVLHLSYNGRVYTE